MADPLRRRYGRAMVCHQGRVLPTLDLVVRADVQRRVAGESRGRRGIGDADKAAGVRLCIGIAHRWVGVVPPRSGVVAGGEVDVLARPSGSCRVPSVTVWFDVTSVPADGGGQRAEHAEGAGLAGIRGVHRGVGANPDVLVGR